MAEKARLHLSEREHRRHIACAFGNQVPGLVAEYLLDESAPCRKMEERSLRMRLDELVPAQPILLCHHGNAYFHPIHFLSSRL